jgi:ureidoacrylate peracid hydrolase
VGGLPQGAVGRQAGYPPWRRTGRGAKLSSLAVLEGFALNTCSSFTPSPHLIERVLARRARLHAYEELQPARTALLVVDMQNSFVQEGGHAWVSAAASTCPAINRLAQALRELGGQVVWVLNTFTPDSLQSWSNFHQALSKPEWMALRSRTMAEGSPGHALYADLQPGAGDWRVLKTRYSAFIAGSSDLHDRLQAQGIDTLLVAGTATHVCCEATARDAMMLNYRTVMLSDGCSAFTPMEHEASLANFLCNFGDVQSCEQAEAHLRATARPAG